MGFDESATLDHRRRLAVARARLGDLEPSWAATDLGQALLDAVAAFEDQPDSGEPSARMPRRIVLVSDLQRGARLDALGDFEWPGADSPELRAGSGRSGNATIQRRDAPDAPVPGDDAQDDDALRVRVSNEDGSPGERFRLRWPSGGAPPVDVSVPAGES